MTHVISKILPMPVDYRFDQPPAVVVGTCGHGLAVIRSLHEGRVPVVALEANRDLPGAHTRLAQVEPVDDINGPSLIKALLALRPRLHCPGTPVLFLTNDNMVRTLAAHWAELEPHYLLSWSHCRDKVAALLEKFHLETHCQRQGLSYPPTYLLHSKSDIDLAITVTGSQAIIKPARPLAGFKTALPSQRQDYEQLIDRCEADLPFLIQKFIPGDDSSIYFCALYLDHGEVLARFDGRKLRSRPLGHTTVAESCRQDDVYQETLRFFAGLELSGPVSLELKRDAKGRLWVIEPTVGRTDFWLGLCTANRVNLPLTEYHSQLGCAEQNLMQGDCALWFNEERDPFGRLWLAFHPQLSLGERHSSYVHFHKNDIRPAVLCAKKILSDLWSSLRRCVALSVRFDAPKSNPADDATAAATAKSDKQFSVEVYLNPSEFPADVLDLFLQAGESNVEAGPDWYANFIDNVVHKPDTAYFYVLRYQQCPVAALPLLVAQKPLHTEIRSLTNYYTSLYAPIVSDVQERCTEALQRLLAAAIKDHAGASMMRFTPMDPASATYKALRDALKMHGWFAFNFFCFGNWFLRVNTTWDDYLKNRSANLRSSVRRRCKRFAADGGTIEIASTSDHIDQLISEFNEIYTASWKKPEPYPDFVPSLIHRLASLGLLRLGVARLKERPIATQLWIVNHNKANIYKVAYHQEFAAYSPGTVLTAHLLRHVIDSDHVQEVDFLIGDDSYKAKWMSDHRERWGILAYNPRTLFGLVFLVKERLGRLVKSVAARAGVAVSISGLIGERESMHSATNGPLLNHRSTKSPTR
ncbi:GNAT family N-acetyltransferase [Candidatus Accumulibacter phosphatis]|uniref:GNAT family N-acetyltransferase n=1 Tax=Candidatus Accumulibacter phosphatis TaxID=327160 RepID=UPI00110A957F|nr:GNAT family N-acetyltransferase [Candidatus Accumulibacter phosphatis]